MLDAPPVLSLPAGAEGPQGRDAPAPLLHGAASLRGPAHAAAGPGHPAPGAQRRGEDGVLPGRPGVPGGHGGQRGRHGLRYGAGGQETPGAARALWLPEPPDLLF